MKDTIVFCLKTDNEESYGEIANFIYKRENCLNITKDDILRISYKYYLKNEINRTPVWIQTISLELNTFKKINSPSKIKNITEKYEIIYCICVDKNSDIINLYNLYLIKQHYTDLKMFVLFQGCDEKQYFTISQFLYTVGIKDSKFYNECYFQYNGRLKRAQQQNITFSRHFTPLQIVDKENMVRLFQDCRGLLTREYFQALSSDKNKGINGYHDLLDGAIKILLDRKGKSFPVFDNKYIKVLQKLDVMAFVLLCYVMCQQTENVTRSLLERYAFQMQQYSNAIRQLAENIVYHSKTGYGIIAIRLHDSESLYMREKYLIKERIGNYLEIIVSDFCRDNSLGNIADDFVSHLQLDEMKALFSGLRPISFFTHNEVDVWKRFYSNPENIGKHFGLRIFQSVVSTYHGVFEAESHSGYINMPGDTYFSYTKSESEICMPGTRYHIVFPLENVHTVMRKQDLSLDSGIDLGSRINSYMSYSIDEMELLSEYEIPQTQQQKNDKIGQLADNILVQLEKLNTDIVYVSFENMKEYMGELIAKAFVIALYQLGRNSIIVAYQCTDNVRESIFDTMKVFYQHTDIEGMFYDKSVQFIMYSMNFEEMVLELSSAQLSDSINAYIAHVKCLTLSNKYLCLDSGGINLDLGAAAYIPCDVLYQVKIEKKTQTLFEHYTEGILKNNIQKHEFGCQLEQTHMRLGSTIHIDKFYEAEILFGNKLFISRFAFLLVKDMCEDIENISKLTLYGYGTYSESVLVQMIEMIHGMFPGKKDVDYIILEREEERRGFQHKDRIRYNKYFDSDEDRVNYFADRKVAIIVLINSTLKTHMRLINLFKEENDKKISDNDWIIKNYAVLLVGNADENAYWEIKENNVEVLMETITPTPHFFVQVDADYQEPLECEQCFPPNPAAEFPLIEVNAASTIPNQAFGIIENLPKKDLRLNYEVIEREENQLSCLRGEFTYGHVQRNENHFLYYFKTENICIKQRDVIVESLLKWRGEKTFEGGLQFHIIVSPMHFSNAGFVELVNNVIFGGNAILLRIDFDKEYRCNAYTKYSYLRNYMEQLSTLNPSGVVHIHYVDDSIISGRTFHRAKSILSSILNLDHRLSNSIQVKIFDKVFVLIDRNSIESRMQYVSDVKTDFYAFITIHISSLRNYGDSCVYCNLKKEADLLYDTASTKLIADYWRDCAKKFKLYSLEEYNEKSKKPDQEPGYDKQFRRLFCTHMAQCILNEKNHGNDKCEALYLILKLLNTDYESRGEDRFEYFLSYLKCISRPFLVFNRNIKEAIFDIMLVLIEAIVCYKSVRTVINEIESKKPYLRSNKLIRQFNRLDKNILKGENLSVENKHDLVSLLMKQLTELKSNYIIRPEKMDALFAFMNVREDAGLKKYYMTLIDRLVGASSDTNKSIWLDQRILESKFDNVPEEFREWVLLENTRTFRDGIEKLYKRKYEGKSLSSEFREAINSRVRKLQEYYDYKRACEMLTAFEEKYKEDLNKYQENSEAAHDVKKRIERFLKSIPRLETFYVIDVLDSVKKSTNNWCDIFHYVKKEIENEYNEKLKKEDDDETKLKLLGLLRSELDIYQFSNFYKLLQEEGYLDNSKISADGADMIACCVKVLSICRNEKLKLLDKVQLLAMLFKVILCAHKVQFIIENETDRNLDEWKYKIEKRYNTIVDKIQNGNSESRLKKISIQGKRHYSIIVERAGSEDSNTEVSMETERLITQLEYMQPESDNYIIDNSCGTFLWKLENDQKSIWINIENQEWCAEESGYRRKIAKAVRKVMMFYQELLNHIFNPENDDFINEISRARKELSIYNSNKVYTHTKDYSKEMLFEQVEDYFRNGENKMDYKNQYPSYVMKLLADSNISQYYRYGLRIDLYNDERGIEKAAQWKDFSSIIRDGQEFICTMDRKKTVSIKLNVAKIEENSEILCTNSPSAIKDMNMLLYALILNAAEQNRGKRQSEKIDVQTDRECVIVNIYKFDGWLVIENECEKKVDVDQIIRKLHYVPDSEEDGISLWSFNCYIKRCINSLISAKLKEIEHNVSDNHIRVDDIQEVGTWIHKLMGQEYEIKPETDENEDGNCCFRVKLPIFMERYQYRKEGDNL